MYTSYKDKLLDPRWQKRRLDILSRDKFTCQNCLGKENTLHVHHRIYISGYEPWEYDDYELITLCYECHKIEEDIIRKKKELFKRLIQIYPAIPRSCPACGNIDMKNYHIDNYLCLLCGYSLYYTEIENYIINAQN